MNFLILIGVAFATVSVVKMNGEPLNFESPENVREIKQMIATKERVPTDFIMIMDEKNTKSDDETLDPEIDHTLSMVKSIPHNYNP